MITQAESGITVAFTDLHEDKNEGDKVVSVRTVLDLNPDNEVIGIEIINLRHQTGCIVKRPYKRMLDQEGRCQLTYDPDEDLLYIRLRKDRSVKQPAIDASAFLDSRNNLLKLEVPIPPPNPE